MLNLFEQQQIVRQQQEQMRQIQTLQLLETKGRTDEWPARASSSADEAPSSGNDARVREAPSRSSGVAAPGCSMHTVDEVGSSDTTNGKRAADHAEGPNKRQK